MLKNQPGLPVSGDRRSNPKGETGMYERILRSTLAALLVFLAGCTTTGSGSGDPDLQRRNIDAGVDSALSELFRQVGGSQELVAQARGVLVFPAVLKAGFIFGVSRGQGALRVGGETRSYHATTGGVLGLAGRCSIHRGLPAFHDRPGADALPEQPGLDGGRRCLGDPALGGRQRPGDHRHGPAAGGGVRAGQRRVMAGISLDGTRITQLNL